MSRRKTNDEKRTRKSEKFKDRMLVEFENEIKNLIKEYHISKAKLSGKAEDQLEKIMDTMVMKYYE